jgi:RNA polymerase sigma-70 factor (ECF subfamily)
MGAGRRRRPEHTWPTMNELDTNDLNWLAETFQDNRERLRQLAQLKINPALLRRLTVDDLVQEVFLAASKRLTALRRQDDIPPYVKFRTILLQTITDLERKYLASQKRDLFKEVEMDRPQDDNAATARWNLLADSVTSPRSRMARAEKHDLLRKVLADMPENDRDILELRHFEELSNLECAAVLGIDPKAASIRHVRALKRFQEKLSEYSEFRW